MKKVLEVILILLLFAVGFHYRYELVGFFRPKPCEEPIPYNIETLDTKFKISEEYFLSALMEAEAIWEKPSGLDLFSYQPEYTKRDVLRVNLIYDYRQQATDKLKSLGISVKETRASYDELKAKFIALKTEYEKDLKYFNAEVSDFNQRQKAYEEEVNYWNKRGGAPKDEYERLEETRRDLDQESQSLKSLQKDLDNMVDEINALVVVLNRLATALNISVEKYNATSTSRGETFEEGLYISDGRERQIDIYEFSSREKLVRVLAHELGHALLLEHVEDTKAIMYELNQGDNTSLTEADRAELSEKCLK